MKLTLIIAMAIAGLTMHAQTGNVDSRAEQLWERASQMSFAEAYPLLVEAARLGHPRAQGALGNLYFNGTSGVPRDYRQAAYWFEAAAKQGNRGAEFNLAGMYTNGQGGLPVDLRKAAELLDASARQNYGPAQEALGICFEFGEGVARNRQSAVYWLDRAAAQGSSTAAEIARALKNRATPQFANEGQLANYILAQRTTPQPARGSCLLWVGSINPTNGVHTSSFSGLAPCVRRH